ncbi:MAG: hypothetical protein GY739_18065, partial [Mesoflavibacter sp.]|nr:hypothetical protein [Mesoflavibacter sp.]
VVATAAGQQLQTVASGHELPIPHVTTAYWPAMLPEHWDQGDRQHRAPVRETLKASLKEKTTNYLFPEEQPAEPWDPYVGATQQRSTRVHDAVMAGVGTMKGYEGRGLDGDNKIVLVRNRQSLTHALWRLQQSMKEANFPVLFVDVEGVSLPKEGESFSSELEKLMHYTRPAAHHGPCASLMQLASVTGECVLIDLFAFRL